MKELQWDWPPLQEQWVLSSKSVKIFITPEAHEYIRSNIEDMEILAMIGKVMRFGDLREYREGKIVAKFSPKTRPVTSYALACDTGLFRSKSGGQLSRISGSTAGTARIFLGRAFLRLGFSRAGVTGDGAGGNCFGISATIFPTGNTESS